MMSVTGEEGSGAPMTKRGPCYWSLFTSTDATSDEIMLRKGVYTTCSKVAQWYLSHSIEVGLAALNGEASPPQFIVRTRGLRSYLWLHFMAAVAGQGIPKFYLIRCDDHTNGCGRWFYSDSSKASRCPDCERLVNRVEQRIKRHPELKGRRAELIEDERNRTSPESHS